MCLLKAGEMLDSYSLAYSMDLLIYSWHVLYIWNGLLEWNRPRGLLILRLVFSLWLIVVPPLDFFVERLPFAFYVSFLCIRPLVFLCLVSK